MMQSTYKLYYSVEDIKYLLYYNII